MQLKSLGWLAAALAPVILSGCGSPGPSGGTSTDGTTGTAQRAGSAAVGKAITVTEEQLRFENRVSTETQANLPFPGALLFPDGEPASTGGSYTYVAFGDGPKDFNPITANDSGSNEVNERLYSPLVGFNNKTQVFQPALLDEWYPDEGDKSQWTLHLRAGLEWSDGKPITADDILFNFQVIYDPNVPNPFRDIMQVGGKPFELTKVDDLTVRLKLAEPSIWVPVMLASLYIVPKHSLELAYQAGTFDQVLNINVKPESLVGSGPFLLQHYDTSERVVLKRNPRYCGVDSAGNRLPHLETLIISYAPDQDQQQLRFEQGTADGFTRPRQQSVSDLMAKQQSGNYTLYNCGPSDGFNCLWFNLKPGTNKDGKAYVDPVKSTWFNDSRFRKACVHAIDKESIIATELRGLAMNVWGMESPGNGLWYDDAITTYPFDLDRARALLDEMGLKDTNNDGVREDAQGNRVAFTFITNKGNKIRENIATLISQDLAEVGIEARPQFVDFNALVTMTADTFDYEACLLGFGGSIFPSNSMNVFRSSGRTHFWNPSQESPATEWEARIDALCNEFISAPSIGEARDAYFEIQRIVADECAFVPLFTSIIFVANRNTYGNVSPTAVSHELLWNVAEFYQK